MTRGSTLLGLLACACAAAAQADPPPPGPGRALFLAHCATCHLGQGGLVGQAGPPDLLAGVLPRGESAEALALWIRNGTGSPAMPAFAEGLSEAEIAELVRYIRAERAARR
jgi:mono/diheme cytochrome c family protein